MWVAFFSATVIEVVLAAGLVGIFIDSFAEKQLRRLGQLAGVTSRRKRIAARVTLQRRRRRIRDTHFVGGYLTRAMADERVRQAALANETSEPPASAGGPSSRQRTINRKSRTGNRINRNGNRIGRNDAPGRNFGPQFSLACRCRFLPKSLCS